jgi:hypothetical protein
VWYTQSGHGEIGKETWTHTNGSVAASTATWTPSGLAANTCYRIDAFVPDNYANNPISVYTVSDATGTSSAAVNQAVQTNDWSELGVFKTDAGGGGLTVKVDDRGNTGLYVAADAMRFWRQASCAAQGNVSPIMMPSSYFGSWSTQSGHSFFGTEHYTTATGNSTPSKNAMWTPNHLVSYGCYDISLYVPDNYSDNPAASYWSNDAYYGPFYEQVNENNYTLQFANIGTFQAYSDGTLPLELFNSGGTGLYVAADAAAFVLNPRCAAENGASNPFGSLPSSSIIGPGSAPSAFSTTGNWAYQLGHGYDNHELYTTATGNGTAATWAFHGAANTCYTAQAFIPNNYANDTAATYTFDTQVGVIGTQINQNVSTGWTSFQGNPRIPTGSDGTIVVRLTGSNGYTAADAISFTPSGC